MHKDDCLSASAFRWQFKNEFMLQYYLILISVISGAASTAMLALSRIPMGPCSMEVFEAGGVDYSHCDDQMTSAHYVWLTISFFWIGVAMFGGYWFIREGLRFRLRFMNIQLGHNYENAPPPTMGKLVHRMAQVSQRSLRGVRTQPGREPEAKGATEMPADGA